MLQTQSTSAPLSIFIFYSQQDEAFKNELAMHLANLKQHGRIRAWQDRDIDIETEWDTEIQQQFEAAEIILLLITTHFLASDYYFDWGVRIMQRYNERTARVIPIIVEPCYWQGTPFSMLQVVPKDTKPITTWSDQNEAFLNVVQGICRVIELLQTKK